MFSNIINRKFIVDKIVFAKIEFLLYKYNSNNNK